MIWSPDKARDLLDGTTPGPWEWEDCDDEGGGTHMALRNPAGEKAVITADAESYQSEVRGTPADLNLAAAAPTLAAMIAGMHTEYQVQRQFAGEWYPCQLDADGMTWAEDQTVADEYADTCRARSIPVRITRRYITTPEEA